MTYILIGFLARYLNVDSGFWFAFWVMGICKFVWFLASEDAKK